MLEVLGRNGCWVDDQYFAKGSQVLLSPRSVLLWCHVASFSRSARQPVVLPAHARPAAALLA